MTHHHLERFAGRTHPTACERSVVPFAAGIEPGLNRLIHILTWRCPACDQIIDCELHSEKPITEGKLVHRDTYPYASAKIPGRYRRNP